MNSASLLIVEDEYAAAEALREALLSAGALCIHAAPTVRAALQILLDHTIDAAVLDVDLEGETSNPVADALSRARIPFVFFTGGSGHAVAEDHRDVPIIRKPGIARLIRKISSICRRPTTGSPADRPD